MTFGDGNGIWFVFPESPIGLSALKGFMELNEAKKTAITEFTNNVAHSNKKNGLRIDDRLRVDGFILPNNRYRPSSPVTINKLTAYKNMENARIRGDDITVNCSSISDSVVGIVMIRSRKGNMKLINSVVLGDSDNLGLPTVDSKGNIIANRSLPRLPRRFRSHPRYGLEVFSSQLSVDSVWFSDFRKTDDYSAGAIHFAVTSPANVITNAQFGFSDPTDGNRLFEKTVNKNPLKHRLYHRLQDVDGSLTTLPKSWIVQPVPFHMTNNCKTKSNWNMAICDESFVQIQAMVRAAATNTMTMHRLDNMASIKLPKKKGLRFNVIVGKMYGVSWDNGVPESIFMRAAKMNKNDSVVIGVCVPRDSVITTWIFGYVRVEVSNLNEVVFDTCGGKFYFDREIGMLFVKLMGTKPRPGFRIKVKANDLSDGKCIKKFGDKYDQKTLLDELHQFQKPRKISTLLEKTSDEPPSDIGSGPTRSGS